MTRRFRAAVTWNQESLRSIPILRRFCKEFGLQINARSFFDEVLHFKPATETHNFTQHPSPTEIDGYILPKDILNVLPTIHTASPDSGIVQSWFDGGRILFQQDLLPGMHRLHEGVTYAENTYGMSSPIVAKMYSVLANLPIAFSARTLEYAMQAVITAERSSGGDGYETINAYVK